MLTFKSAVVRTGGGGFIPQAKSGRFRVVVENGTSFEVSRWPRPGQTSWSLVKFTVKMWPSLFLPLPLQPEWASEARDVSTMSLKGETELGGMKREAGRGLKGPEVLGVGGSRRGSVQGNLVK